MEFIPYIELFASNISSDAIQEEIENLAAYKAELESANEENGDFDIDAAFTEWKAYEHFLNSVSDEHLYSEDAAIRDILENAPDVQECYKGYVDFDKYVDDVLSGWECIEYDGYTFYY